MRLLTLPLYQYNELSETARADALQAIRDERISIFVKHELPELIDEIKTLVSFYGFLVIGYRMRPFSEQNHVVIVSENFGLMGTAQRKKLVEQLNMTYDASNVDDHFTKEATFQEALSDYLVKNGPAGHINFADFFQKMITYAWKTRLACVENSIDSEHDSIRFAYEMEYEFTERGAIFEH